MTHVNITPCLLDNNNTCPLHGSTIASRIQASGKQHLWDTRPSLTIDTIVIHYISALDVNKDDPFNLEMILAIFCDFKVSSHYLILRDGVILSLVPEEQRAWHCGGSIMPEPDNRIDVNNFSLGIELVATHDSGYTDIQYDSLIWLCNDMQKRYNRKFLYTGHQDIAGTRAVDQKLRTNAKEDPGPLFNWKRFKQGITQFC